MFKKSGYSVALGSTSDEVEENARFLTKDIYQDGNHFACLRHAWV